MFNTGVGFHNIRSLVTEVFCEVRKENGTFDGEPSVLGLYFSFYTSLTDVSKIGVFDQLTTTVIISVINFRVLD